MKQPIVSRSSLVFWSVVYLGSPLVIFFFGWLKPAWAVLSTCSLLFSAIELVRLWPGETSAFRSKDVLTTLGLSLAICALTGIGGFAPQQFDWGKHNAVLWDCVCQRWPVMLVAGPARWPLVYYLAWYLPAALVGKAAGYDGARVALWVWSSFGLALSSLWFARLTRLPVLPAVAAFFAFSGLAFVANLVVQLLGLPGYHGWTGLYPSEVWGRIWQIGSHFWMLEWAPGQALAGWLSAALFLASPKLSRFVCLGFLLTCDLLWSPFIAIGLALLAFSLWWRSEEKWPSRPLSPLLFLAAPLGILVAYLAAKLSPEVTARFPPIPLRWFTQFQDAPSSGQSVVLLFLYIVFQFGIFLAFIWAGFPKASDERKGAEACGIALLALLPVTMGYYNDLAMRASIVPWFGLAVILTRTVVSGNFSPRLRPWFHLVIVLAALTPLVEMGDQVGKLLAGRYDPSVALHGDPALVNLAAGGFNFFGAQYVGSTNSFFWHRLAR